MAFRVMVLQVPSTGAGADPTVLGQPAAASGGSSGSAALLWRPGEPTVLGLSHTTLPPSPFCTRPTNNPPPSWLRSHILGAPPAASHCRPGTLGQDPAGGVGGEGQGPVPGGVTAAGWAIARGGRGHLGACRGSGMEPGAALPGKQQVSVPRSQLSPTLAMSTATYS